MNTPTDPRPSECRHCVKGEYCLLFAYKQYVPIARLLLPACKLLNIYSNHCPYFAHKTEKKD